MKQEKKQKQVQPKKVKESLSYTVEVRDKEGRIIKRVSAPSRSYVEQWNQLISGFASEKRSASGPYITATDTSGVVQTQVWFSIHCLRADAGIAVATKGIRVGKGTTAVAITDYALETPLGEGTGLDEFNHQAMVFTEPAVVGSTCSFTAKRIMVNNSGAPISGIKEIGCYVSSQVYPTVLKHFMGFRDVLPSAVSVPNGGSITVTYTIAVTV